MTCLLCHITRFYWDQSPPHFQPFSHCGLLLYSWIHHACSFPPQDLGICCSLARILLTLPSKPSYPHSSLWAELKCHLLEELSQSPTFVIYLQDINTSPAEHLSLLSFSIHICTIIWRRCVPLDWKLHEGKNGTLFAHYCTLPGTWHLAEAQYILMNEGMKTSLLREGHFAQKWVLYTLRSFTQFRYTICIHSFTDYLLAISLCQR